METGCYYRGMSLKNPPLLSRVRNGTLKPLPRGDVTIAACGGMCRPSRNVRWTFGYSRHLSDLDILSTVTIKQGGSMGSFWIYRHALTRPYKSMKTGFAFLA
jgi:hypothetical protein